MTTETQAGASCCSTTSAPSAANPAAVTAGSKNLLADDSAEMTTCPVMVGSAVTKATAVAAGLFRDFEGERYYFCCAGCGPAFDSDPAKYAANMA
ncbi:YHS domain-containing protein [Leucobacter luti]|uniref:YHS domain-containing protein n=1 Tax=Leucobacter luti TaxID=340320 RepID=A0A4R6S6B1_9MICO|nr:YHS domain-containing protein [Leucobacter luti]TDP94305.1 YHS domain-containing protein [Leucobacter luti]